MSTLKFPNEHLAVFNQHVNDAGQRALVIVRKRCAIDAGGTLVPVEEGDPRGIDALETAYRDGSIMEIFDAEPTLASHLFASACFIFANGLDQRDEGVPHPLLDPKSI